LARLGHRALVVALLVGAHDHRLRPRAAEQQVRRGAERARLGDGLLPELEVALDGFVLVVRAAVERLPAALLRANLDEVPPALGAGDAERHRLRVLALRVAGARQERAVPPAADDHRLAALVAVDARLLVDRGLAVLPEVARVLALGVVRAAEEPPVLRPALEHHAAVDVALLVGGLGLRVPALQLLALVELLAGPLVEAVE